MRVLSPIVLAGLFSLLLAGVASGQFYSVGRPDGSLNGTWATGLSYDGRVACGTAEYPGGYYYGFVWSRDRERYDFGRDPGLPVVTTGMGISGDGTVVVGQAPTQQAYRWSEVAGYQSLGNVGGNFWTRSTAIAASGNGSVVVGNLEARIGPAVTPFIWSADRGMRHMGTGAGAIVEAHGVSEDGSMVVGSSYDQVSRGFVWTEDTGYRFLPGLPGTNGESSARGMNRDGSVLVGFDIGAGNGIMWTNDRVVNLGKLSGSGSFIGYDADDEGSVVVGTSQGGFVGGATVWTQFGGTELLTDYLRAQGVVLPMNVVLSTCTAVSSDGLTFTGIAYIDGQSSSNFGYVVTVPAPSILLISLAGSLTQSARRKRESTQTR